MKPPPAEFTPDAEVVAQLASFAEAERDGSAALAWFAVGPFTAYTLIALLQLAYRHPDLSDEQRAIVKKITDQLEPLFTGPVAASLAEGWRT